MWIYLPALPAIPLLYLLLKIKESTVGLKHNEAIGWLLLSFPVGIFLWIVLIYEIIQHVRIV